MGIRSSVRQVWQFGFIAAGALYASFFSLNVFSDEFLVEGVPKIDAARGDSESVRSVPHFEDLARELSSTVVNISVETDTDEEKEADDSEGGPPPGFPFFRPPPGEPMRSLGSGFVVSEDGLIVTNYHVIENAEKIIVRLLDDETEYVAKIVGKDEKTDLALVKIDAKKSLSSVYLGDSSKLQVGEWVLAIGNQFQLGQTVTAGIVSAKSRKVPSRASGPYDDFIQTDASINPGSSGGPLFNGLGQVIGINTAIFSPGRGQFGGTGFNIGIGFAIPINLAKGVVRQLKEYGKVTRGLLGVIIQHVDSDIAEALALDNTGGALVADVVKDSPAEKAGFKVKDIIIKYDGREVKHHDDLPLMVANTPIGTDVKIEILRGGSRKTLHATVVELQADSVPTKEEVKKPKSNELGLIVQDVTEDIAKSLNLPSAFGVIVNSVEANLPAQRAGIVRGDVLEELDNQPIPNEESLTTVLKGLKKGKPVLALVRRKEGTRFLTLKLK